MRRPDYELGRTDFGLASVERIRQGDQSAPVGHTGLTSRLGCSEMDVDVYRLEGGSISVSSWNEYLCLPVRGEGTVQTDDSMRISTSGGAFVPATVDFSLASETDSTWVVVSAPGDATTEREPASFDGTTCQYSTPETSDVQTAHLTDPLGCTGMKVNVRRLEPGQVVPYHVEGWQEELFVPLTAPGTMRIAGRTYELPRGSISRVAPKTPRSAVNHTDEASVWVMVGAPPTGGGYEWDPGAVILE